MSDINIKLDDAVIDHKHSLDSDTLPPTATGPLGQYANTEQHAPIPLDNAQPIEVTKHLDLDQMEASLSFLPKLQQLRITTKTHVCVRKNDGKWAVCLTSRQLKHSLGLYDSEDDAVFARNYAIRLLGQPSFSRLIPPGGLPTAERQRVIKRLVELGLEQYGSIKEPPKAPKAYVRISAISGYMGVTRGKRGKWQSSLASKRAFLGTYDSKHESAFAYNYAINLFGDPSIPQNVIPPDCVPTEARQLEIKANVELRLQKSKIDLPVPTKVRSVSQGRVSAATGFRGVQENKTAFTAYVKYNGRNLSVGTYATKYEAGLAYNHAVRTLSADHVSLNHINHDDMPNPEKLALIALNVDQHLWKHGLIDEPPGNCNAAHTLRVTAYDNYHGVGLHKASKSWAVRVAYRGIELHLAYFKTSHQAAFAYNHAIAYLGLPDALLNHIPEDNVPDHVTEQYIHAKVEARLARLKLPPTHAFATRPLEKV